MGQLVHSFIHLKHHCGKNDRTLSPLLESKHSWTFNTESNFQDLFSNLRSYNFWLVWSYVQDVSQNSTRYALWKLFTSTIYYLSNIPWCIWRIDVPRFGLHCHIWSAIFSLSYRFHTTKSSYTVAYWATVVPWGDNTWNQWSSFIIFQLRF